jgi:putative transposase
LLVRKRGNGDVNSIACPEGAGILPCMARHARVAPPGQVYHVMNRAAGRYRMLKGDKDFAAMERLIIEAHETHPLRILSYCLMGNHWHFVVWPAAEGQMSEFFRWLTLTHAVRWRVAHRTVGWGHLYRGRFKSFPIQRDERLLEALRYVERNALSAGLVRRAEDWRWSSLWARRHGPAELRAVLRPWPVRRPSDWTAWVNEAIGPRELERLELSERRGRPFGEDRWVAKTVAKLGLEHTVRPEGRPRIEKATPKPGGT